MIYPTYADLLLYFNYVLVCSQVYVLMLNKIYDIMLYDLYDGQADLTGQ